MMQAGETQAPLDEQRSYSYAELSRLLGAKPRTLRKWRAEGRLIPAFSVGKRVTRLRINPAMSTYENAARSAKADGE